MISLLSTVYVTQNFNMFVCWGVCVYVSEFVCAFMLSVGNEKSHMSHDSIFGFWITLKVVKFGKSAT